MGQKNLESEAGEFDLIKAELAKLELPGFNPNSFKSKKELLVAVRHEVTSCMEQVEFFATNVVPVDEGSLEKAIEELTAFQIAERISSTPSEFWKFILDARKDYREIYNR